MPNETRRLKAELAEAGDEDLQRLLAQYKQEHFGLRMQAATGAMDNPKRIWFVRKAVARIETEMTRRRQASAGGA